MDVEIAFKFYLLQNKPYLEIPTDMRDILGSRFT